MADLLEQLQARVADRYRLDREIGRGGAATVYSARDLKHSRIVAIKVLRPELGIGTERFLREITLVANLRHPHILPLHDSGEAGGLLYYVMPFVQGESLRERIAHNGPLPFQLALEITQEVAGALDYAHRMGVVHRDIKPANIMLEEGHAVVTDFGIARTAESEDTDNLTAPGLTVGTPTYMSPEQVNGEATLDRRSDIYSLGCVLYEALTGSPPFKGATPLAVMAQRLAGPPAPIAIAHPDFPAVLDDLLFKALAVEPGDRFATAAEFGQALAVVAAGSDPELALVSADRAAVRLRSIAVLPFVNMSADPDNEYFTDGITEDVINALTKIAGLRVAARTSAFAFKGKDADVREIGRRLNVGTVLEGSVRRAANRLRVTAQLVDVADGYHLWSEKYDRELDDVFAVQDEISCAIVERLKGRLGSTAGGALVKPQTRNMEAYDLYVRGRYFWNQRGAGLLRAREYFTQALALDPEYAPAHAALGDTYNLLGWYRVLAPRDAFPVAKAAAERAIALDDTLAAAHTSLAFSLMCHNWDWKAAEREFVRAIELNPGYATTHHWYSEFLMAMGRPTEAVESAERAVQADPLGLIIKIVLAMAHYFALNYDRTIEICSATLATDRSFTPAHIWLGLAHMQLGHHDRAVDVFQREHDLAPERPTTLALLGVAYASAGKTDEAEGILRQLKEAATESYVSHFDLALIHLFLKRRETAVEQLERAYEERAAWLTWAKVDPLLDPLRSEPRFRALLGKMNLA
jgi:serine/threonine-protein kinase